MTTTSSTTTTTYPQYIPSIPYTDPPGRLQTLDIWLPRPFKDPNPSTSLWIIYIHGGAWRDPLQDSDCIKPTLTHLFSSHASSLSHIAGIASLNYRLSPFTSHPTAPSSPSDSQRNAVHPQHIRDVARGVAWLQKQYGVDRWIGVGHSCGASLLLQLVGGMGVPANVEGVKKPLALLLLEGIYNIPLLLRNHLPPSCPEDIARIYSDFVAGAFGSDTAVYTAVSPVSGHYGRDVWPEGRLIMVCHSYEDELVERAQRDVLCVALDREGWSLVMEDGDEEDVVKGEEARVLNVRDVKGGHDWIWGDGEQIARLIAEVVGRFV